MYWMQLAKCQGVQRVSCIMSSYLRRVTGPTVGGFYVLLIIPFRQRMQWIISWSMAWSIPCLSFFVIHSSSYGTTHFHHHVHRSCPEPAQRHVRPHCIFPQIPFCFYSPHAKHYKENLVQLNVEVEQYQDMCIRYKWVGWESQEESKKAMNYARNDQ